MKIGEKITVERLPSGMYEITGTPTMTTVGRDEKGPVVIIGAAASTAATLLRLVFRGEISGDNLEKAA